MPWSTKDVPKFSTIFDPYPPHVCNHLQFKDPFLKRMSSFGILISYRQQPPRSLAFELDIYPHLLDPQSVFRWSKIFITLPQRSGLESLGHSVTDGKTILSMGKVSTTDFMGFSIQPVSLNFIYSRY